MINQPIVAVETGYNADGSLKAYWVKEVGADFGMWIHAESAGKAKSIFLQENPFTDGPEFVDLRATRPLIGSDLLDVTPFTDYTLELARHPRDPEEQAEFPDAFLLTCPCSMCKYELTKPDYRVSIRTTSYHIKALKKEMAEA